MDAPAGCCTFCGEPAVDRHHLTGRGPSGAYIHPGLVADLCHQHHELVHNDLRVLDLDTIGGNPTRLDVIAFAHRRIGCFLGRLGRYLDNPLWPPLALVLASMAQDLGRIGPSEDRR